MSRPSTDGSVPDVEPVARYPHVTISAHSEQLVAEIADPRKLARKEGAQQQPQPTRV